MVRRDGGAHLRGHGIHRLPRSKHALLDGKGPNILVIAPPPIDAGYVDTESLPEFGPGAREKSLALAQLYEKSAKRLGCAFFDAGPVSELNRVDCLHLTRKGCRSLAAALAEIIPGLCG